MHNIITYLQSKTKYTDVGNLPHVYELEGFPGLINKHETVFPFYYEFSILYISDRTVYVLMSGVIMTRECTVYGRL
jgi:hypothetical protein